MSSSASIVAAYDRLPFTISGGLTAWMRLTPAERRLTAAGQAKGHGGHAERERGTYYWRGGSTGSHPMGGSRASAEAEIARWVQR